jgi:hypothetical protein
MTIAASPLPVSASIQVNGLSTSHVSGLAAMILAFDSNYKALQNYDVNMLNLSANMSKQQNTLSTAIITKMNEPVTGPIAMLQSNAGRNNNDASKMQADAATYSSMFQVLNTQYGQVAAQYNGLVTSTTQGASDVTQTMQTNLTMMGTNGVLAVLQALSRMV